MIRGTHNEGISSLSKQLVSPAANTGIIGDGVELVLAGANEAAAVITEKRETEVKAAFQTAFTSNPFTGSYE